MARFTMNTPEGTRDLLYGDCCLRRQVQRDLTGVFRRCGYSEIATPVVEYYQVFSRAGSAVAEEGTLKMIDRSGRILVLRPDCTLPIARVAATHLRHEPLPLRLYYNETIFRAAKANAGHMSEVDQCGVELIGSPGRRADAEVVATALQALQSCGLQTYRIELGHAGFFKALADELETDVENVETIRTLIEQKSFAALDDFLRENFSDRPSCEALRRLSRLFGGEDVLSRARALTGNSAALQALDELEQVYRELCAAGWQAHVGFDLGLVHQIDYYTGMVFCGYVEGYGHVVVTGGRYDCLMERYGRSAPATGFAIDVDGVASALRGAEMQRAQKLIHYEPGCLAAAMELQRRSAPGEAELSCCETVEESRRLAREKGIASLVLVRRDGVSEETI
ncbi:MAG TPA: ATP phosphoribosyltransferase regulatory subunit [Firmicutes bacterium]|nr:ATP phosphoribosyltransferase regulatory subunit [Bacillota bacterium]